MEEINRPQSLKEIAAERIREAIVEGRLKMGESLSENFLAQNLQVSKTPIREALSLLNMEGLVNIVPQKGTFVFSMEKPEIIELCELRFALESLALRYSHERNREPFLKDLERLFKLMRKNQKKEIKILKNILFLSIVLLLELKQLKSTIQLLKKKMQ